jgi:hypothetical protein
VRDHRVLELAGAILEGSTTAAAPMLPDQRIANVLAVRASLLTLTAARGICESRS